MTTEITITAEAYNQLNDTLNQVATDMTASRRFLMMPYRPAHLTTVVHPLNCLPAAAVRWPTDWPSP